MYSEIGFIFNPALSLNNKDNTGNIYGKTMRIRPRPINQNTSQGLATPTNSGQSGQNSPGTEPIAEEGILVYKNPNEYVGTVGIKNYLVETVYKDDNLNQDPYISLIRYFDGTKTKALTLRAADFAYLKDLGVYPINRLWVLRRFPDNCIVPNNLLAWGNAIEPISTVVGWMKDNDSAPLFTVSFNEIWVDETQMIDKLLGQILQDEFGFKLAAAMPVPGWSQGLLFGMLNAMGLTSEFDSKNVPTGNPNVLRISKRRDVSQQGLSSSLSLTLETCYEQKYINGIDPGLAMLDILTNLFKMGTSDQKFVLGNSPILQKFLGNINAPATKTDAWLGLINELVNAFIKGITEFIEEIKKEKSFAEDSEETGEENEDTNQDQEERTQSMGVSIPDSKIFGSMGSFISGLGDTILTGTISKYRWPLKGSIALMTGINTTPWHLTIGNPYSPIINIGNVVVGGIDVKPSNDLGFNDMPARIDVSISTSLGRPLGKQELEKMFNNGYKRVYSTKNPTSLDLPEVTSNTTASGIPAPFNASNRQNPDWISDAGGINNNQNNNPWIPYPPVIP